VDPEPGEIVFFDGHPSWLSMAGLFGRGLAAAVAAGAVAGVITAIAAGHVEVGWIVVAVAAVFVLLAIIGQIRRIQTTYAITNQRLTIETGIVSRRMRQTRLERVQNVNTSQSLAERVLHIGTVDFDTAGEADYDFSFRGVGDPRGIVRTVDRALHDLRGTSPDPQGSAGV
jgi:uncharacterized membrane protein YdbT with pleckstrin-like domain